MAHGLQNEDKAVKSGHWLLYHYNPDLIAQGKNPLQIDSKDISLPVDDFVATENRYGMLQKVHPDAAQMLWDKGQRHVCTRWGILKQQAEMVYSDACPFEPGVVDEGTHAATGARSVTGASTGPNMPASGELPHEDEEE